MTLSIFTLSYSQGEQEQTKLIFETFITGVFKILKDSPFKKLYEAWQPQTKKDFLNLIIKLITFLQLLLKGGMSHELFRRKVEEQKPFLLSKKDYVFEMLSELLTKNVWNSMFIKNEVLSSLKGCFKFYKPEVN